MVLVIDRSEAGQRYSFFLLERRDGGMLMSVF